MSTYATFDQFVADTYDFELIAPTGDKLKVLLRPLTPEELLRIGRDYPLPKLQPSGFEKDPTTNALYAKYEPREPGYVQQREEHASIRMRAQIARSLVEPEVPGETEAERMEHLMKLPNWVLSGLWAAVEKLNMGQAGELLAYSFRGNGAHTHGGPEGTGMD